VERRIDEFSANKAPALNRPLILEAAE